jgi:hypothetical protein
MLIRPSAGGGLAAGQLHRSTTPHQQPCPTPTHCPSTADRLAAPAGPCPTIMPANEQHSRPPHTHKTHLACCAAPLKGLPLLPGATAGAWVVVHINNQEHFPGKQAACCCSPLCPGSQGCLSRRLGSPPLTAATTALTSRVAHYTMCDCVLLHMPGAGAARP